MNVIGEFKAQLELKDKKFNRDIVVIDSEKSFGLLGRTVICDPEYSNGSVGCNSVESGQYLKTIKGAAAKIRLKPDAKLLFCKARPIPVMMQDKVKKAIDKLIAQGVLEKVPPGGAECASPIVCVLKKNGEIRICADFKVFVNSVIMDEYYALPRIESIFADMGNAKYFAKIDLAGAYN